MPEESQEFVVVKTVGNAGALAVAEALLRGDGIEYYVENAAMERVFPTEGSGTEAARILTRPEDAEAAREILADVQDHTDADEEADEPESPMEEM